MFPIGRSQIILFHVPTIFLLVYQIALLTYLPLQITHAIDQLFRESYHFLVNIFLVGVFVGVGVFYLDFSNCVRMKEKVIQKRMNLTQI